MERQPVVLVADDDEDVLELVAFRLRRAGYRTVTARDGREALEMVHAEHPDLSVLDVAMPEMDGLEVTRALRGSASTRGMPLPGARRDGRHRGRRGRLHPEALQPP